MSTPLLRYVKKPENDEKQVNKGHRGKKRGKEVRGETQQLLKKRKLNNHSEDPESDSRNSSRPQSAAEKEEAKRKAQALNPKAFTFQNPEKAHKAIRRDLDLQEKKMHMPITMKQAESPPPLFVAVVGPPQVGKSTLIRSLVKYYSNHSVNKINGTITVVANYNRRITFYECPNDINSFIDVAKVADLVLLLIDASFGFEMETFEMLNIMQVHGFPKVIGCLTHLDLFKDSKKLNHLKRTLKKRFWREIYAGAKLFYLSGLKGSERRRQDNSATLNYSRYDMINLGRFIVNIKLRPLIWKSAHSYVVSDRVEDITKPELIDSDPYVDRNVVMYGWIRGVNLKDNSKITIPGVGDYRIKAISELSDPCPLPKKNTEEIPLKKKLSASTSGPKKKGGRRALRDDDRLIYAPMSDVGNIKYDKDAIYIKLPADQMTFTAPDDENINDEELPDGVRMVRKLQKPISENNSSGGLKLFSHSTSAPQDLDEEGDDDGEQQQEEEDQGRDTKQQNYGSHRERRKWTFDDGLDEEGNDDDDGADNDDDDDANQGKDIDEDEDDLEDDGQDDEQDDIIARKTFNFDAEERENLKHENLEFEDEDKNAVDDDAKESEYQNLENFETKWKANLTEKAKLRFPTPTLNLADLVYGHPNSTTKSSKQSNQGPEDGDFFTPKINKVVDRELDEEGDDIDAFDCSKFSSVAFNVEHPIWESKELSAAIKLRFSASGAEAEDQLANQLDQRLGDSMKDQIEQIAKGNTDTKKETPQEKAERKRRELILKKEMLKKAFNMEYDQKADQEDEDADQDEDQEGTQAGSSTAGKTKETFATYYDEVKAAMAKQEEKNQSLIKQLSPQERKRMVGHDVGSYVRIEIEGMPAEFIKFFDGKYLTILGGILQSEEGFGFSQVRIKKHRWSPRILKSNDPLIISIGWRRFQTIPIFSVEDANGRIRMIKYTPEHMHCNAIFFGPFTAPNTGFAAFRSLDNNLKGFRVSGTGVVLDINQSYKLVKKLKLTGYPEQIFKKTAYIRGMFNSNLEITKFIGAQIRTVSGIRGQIKKASKREGFYRATFEDTISKGDIVFLRAWVQQHPKRFYLPVSNLLEPVDPNNPRSRMNWSKNFAMRLTGTVRYEMGVPVPNKTDSQYHTVVRKKYIPEPVVVTKDVMSNLPYKDRVKQSQAQTANLKRLISRIQKRQEERPALVMDPKEARVHQEIQRITLLKNYQLKQERQRIAEEKVDKERREKHIVNKKEQAKKDRRKNAFAKLQKKGKNYSNNNNNNKSSK